MAQIKHPSCQVTNGSQTVKLLGVDYASQIPANSIFLVQPDYIAYTVASPATFDGTDTVITLTGAYQGVTDPVAAGVITKDMTASGIPTLSQRDVGTAAVFTQAMNRIQELINKISPGGLDTAYDNAEAAATKAQQWADNDENVEVEPGLYSAKHWAAKAKGSVDAALLSLLKYYGGYNASVGNFPAPANVGKAGDVYRITTEGLIGGVTYKVGTFIFYDGAGWYSMNDGATSGSPAPAPAPAPSGDTVTLTGAQTLTNKTLVNPINKDQTLTDGTNISWNLESGQTAYLTLSTTQVNRVIASPTNLKKGGVYFLAVTQHPQGNQAITSWGSLFTMLGSSDVAVDANSVTLYQFVSDGSKLYGVRLGYTGAAPSPAPAPSAGQATFVANPYTGTGYSFGSRADAHYGRGILPTQVVNSPTTADNNIKTHYDNWKTARLVTSIPTIPGGYAVKFSGTTYLTVSEGMGYGMLIAVAMAGYDPNARTIFDALLTTVRARPAFNVKRDLQNASNPNAWVGDYLMEWELNADGSSINDGYNACDGDMDIALALLMADRQWGSTGTWNYAQQAANTIFALKTWNFKTQGYPEYKNPGTSRVSDWMFAALRAYAQHTNDSYWSTTAVQKLQAMAQYLQTTYSASAGLVPDFIKGATTSTPSPADAGQGDPGLYGNEGDYYWNSCRVPWRWGEDFLLRGDSTSKTLVGRIVDFFHGKYNAAGTNDVNAAMTAVDTGYHLDGSVIAGGDSAAYMGPVMVGAMSDIKYQSFLDALWTWNTNNNITGYFDGEIQLISKLIASGNWWAPRPISAAPAPAPAPTPAPSPAPTPAPAPAPSAAETLMQTQFDAGNNGWWGECGNLNEFYTESATTSAHPAYSGAFGRWVNHGNTSNGHDAVETDLTKRGSIQDDGTLKYANLWNDMKLLSVGGSTGAFYACLALDATTYYGTFLSDAETANIGIRLNWNGDDGQWHFSAGTGSARTQVNINGTQYAAPGKHVVEVWFDGTDIGLRVDKGTPSTLALGAASITVGGLDMALGGNLPSESDMAEYKLFGGVVLKNYCPSSTDRDTIATYFGTKAGMTI